MPSNIGESVAGNDVLATQQRSDYIFWAIFVRRSVKAKQLMLFL